MKKFAIIVIVMVAGLLAAGPTLAMNNTATNSGNWNVGSIWSQGWSPLAGEDVSIQAGVTVTNSETSIPAISTLSVAGTLQLAHTNAIGAASNLTLSSGATLQLRSDTTATFNLPQVTANPGSTTTIDINNVTAGSGQTLTLSSGFKFNPAGGQNGTLNVTGGNGYKLNTGTFMIPSPNGGSFTINPATASVVIASLNYSFVSGQGYTLYLGGTGSSNTVDSLANGQWLYFTKNTANAWTWNPVVPLATPVGNLTVSAGNFILNGTIRTYNQGVGLTVSGGVLHYNNAGGLDSSTYGLASGLILSGGNLDQTSGSAINTSTYNPMQQWNANFTFLGSNGTNSDLNIGTGAVAMSASRIVTVNSNATLTVGGVISGGGFSLNKAGTGTLNLTGVNTYNGPTTVSAGTLILSGNSTCTGATAVTNGILVGVVGGSCSNSAVTVTNTGALSISVTNDTKQWTCANLALNNGSQLKFVFDVKPSTTVAPLNIAGNLDFDGTPLVVVDPSRLAGGITYPLLVAGVAAPADVPALSLSGMPGSLAWGGPGGKTLLLSIAASGTVIVIR